MTTDDHHVGNREGGDLDPAIRSLFAGNEGEVDTRDFAERLDSRLATVKRRRRSRPVRTLVIVVGVAVLAASVGVGAWQGLERLGGQREALLFGDATDTTAVATSASTSTTITDSTGGYTVSTAIGSSSSYATDSSPATLLASVYSSHVAPEVTGLKFADLWEEAASYFGIDPATARLDCLDTEWAPDGLLLSFNVTGFMPDGFALDLYVGIGPGPGGADSELTVTGSVTVSFGSYARNQADPKPMVQEVLRAIDGVGLMQFGIQSGLQVDGDPEQLAQQSGMDPADAHLTHAGGKDPLADTKVGAVRWKLTGGTSWASDAGSLEQNPGAPKVAAISEGELSLLDAADVPASLLPAVRFDLSRAWVLVDKDSGVERGTTVRSGEVVVLIAGLSDPNHSAASLKAQPVDATLDGLAFVTSKNWVQRISDGATVTVWSAGSPYTAGFASFGVAYSTGRSLMLYAGAILEATVGSSDETIEVLGGRDLSTGGSSGSSSGLGTNSERWSWKSIGQTALMTVPVTGSTGPVELLRRAELPCLNNVRYDESTDTVWMTSFGIDHATAALLKTHPHDGSPETIELAHSFSGDFAVSPDGSTIIYIGTRDDPAICLHTADGDKSLPVDLARAYMPVFSPDGSKVCLVGSEGGGAPTSLWLYDLAGATWTKIEATEGRTPTYPVFSPDGRRIAFRNWALGDLWTVDTDGGGLTRYDLPVAEAPIAW